MCWIWLIGDTSTFLRPPVTFRAGTCMFSNRKNQYLSLHFSSTIGNEMDAWMNSRKDYTLQFLMAIHKELDNPVK